MRFPEIFCFLLLSGLLFLQVSCGNTQHFGKASQNDSVLVLVKKYVNDQNTEALYGLTGEAFRSQVSKEEFSTIATGHLFPLGKILSDSLLVHQDGVSRYKVRTEAIPLTLVLGVDMAGKLETFEIVPYKPPVRPDAVATSNRMVTPLDKQVDSIARDYIQHNNTAGLALGVIRNDQITRWFYGETARGNGILPGDSTLFEIGSITKTFTSILLAYCANAGKVRLSDPVTRYLPDSVAANNALDAVTLETLSNHTSGLPRMPGNFSAATTDPRDPYAHYGRDLLFSFLTDCQPQAAPGSRYEYSNLGVALLGIALENASGTSHEEMVQQVICDPLGMNHTFVHLDEANRDLMATVHDGEGRATPAWNFKVMAAAGAIRSSIRDLLLYARANLYEDGRDDLSKAIALTHQKTFDGPPAVGLGWHFGSVKGHQYVGHGGGTYGSSSFLAVIPSEKLGVVVLSNAAEQTNETAMRLLQVLLSD